MTELRRTLKPLDIVKSKKGSIMVIAKCNGHNRYSVVFVKGFESYDEKVAWWDEDELTYLDSIPSILVDGMAISVSDGGDVHFPGRVNPE